MDNIHIIVIKGDEFIDVLIFQTLPSVSPLNEYKEYVKSFEELQTDESFHLCSFLITKTQKCLRALQYFIKVYTDLTQYLSLLEKFFVWEGTSEPYSARVLEHMGAKSS